MANLKEIFPNNHVILPVIHVKSESQVVANAQITQDAGCDGVFLIDMDGRGHQKLFHFHRLLRKEMSQLWIGLNCLDLRADHLFPRLPEGVNGVWADDACIHESCGEKQYWAELIQKAREESGWHGLYFGGVAFKYQHRVEKVGVAAKIATKYMDVVTTSGEATGKPPEVEKIAVMKEAIGNHPLGIASGISPANVTSYTSYADCFLVATSLLVPGTENFDPAKVRQLVQNIR